LNKIDYSNSNSFISRNKNIGPIAISGRNLSKLTSLSVKNGSLVVLALADLKRRDAQAIKRAKPMVCMN